MSNYTLKQVILVRNDLKLPRGKLAAQAAHASVEATLRSDAAIVREWRSQGMAKIVLKVDNEKQLLSYFQKAKDDGITASLITDAGHTVVEPGTKTCVGIGPDDEHKIDFLTAKLKLL
ncbi:aminoacyl-tRNA hydrolase [archaeon]|nr:aminoacyl-tRNA hydrolase [archaeon]|tara:strand:+ start:1725 stop:2078 length:354 start_codon:yes stop_codon:yes gene_type:complete